MKKHWRKLLAASLIVGSLFSSPTADAEVKMYTAMGVDYGNELESQDIVKLRARDKAIADYTKAIELGKDNETVQVLLPWIYYMRSECYKALGDKAKAQADMKKHKELEKK